jgi:transcriptional regulator with XRE-family HTH domain
MKVDPITNMENIRKRKRITKTLVAQKCGRTGAWYGAIANRKRRVYLEDFLLIADALEEDVVNFF